MHPLLAASLRNQAIYVPAPEAPDGANGANGANGASGASGAKGADGASGAKGANGAALRETTGTLLANLHRLGFLVAQPLRDALNAAPTTWQADVLLAVREVRGVDKNWTPLVKGWEVPTGESRIDHLITWFVNLVGGRGTKLPCGHVIPPGTFPLERYNGCPFCGTPFEVATLALRGEGAASRRTVLDLWTLEDAQRHLQSLLTAKTALDASQRESLRGLLGHLGLPPDVATGAITVAMKETRMLVVEALVASGHGDQAGALFTTPAELLRYLWYKKTGLLQVVEPRTLIRRRSRNSRHLRASADLQQEAADAARAELRLHYSRPECRQVARWLEALITRKRTSPEAACEIMHPKRRIWVRMIRALRLAELARRPEFPGLAELLRTFYSRTYPVYAGALERARRQGDMATALRLLQQRPGVFARGLFSNMLTFGPEPVVKAFAAVIDRVPARLVFSLQTMAEGYFVGGNARVVRPLGGVPKRIAANRLRALYAPEALRAMPAATEDLCLVAVRRRFAGLPTPSRTIYIDPTLFKMPVAIGERSETVQDLPAALMGTRFPVEGDQVRLFLQWGVGLPAQHLDMDLSCRVVFSGREETCAFYSLTSTGCKHSGDIRSIPEKVGTAEYIELDLRALAAAGARYAVFFCNAYSTGSLSPGLVVGWMNSAHPMKISQRTGVAYDPSCVQHQVRITQALSKGLVFGVLEVATREIVWLEMSVAGQLAAGLNLHGVELLLRKLNARLSVGNLLKIKAEAQNLTVVETPGADEDYTARWALDAAAVTALLVD